MHYMPECFNRFCSKTGKLIQFAYRSLHANSSSHLKMQFSRLLRFSLLLLFSFMRFDPSAYGVDNSVFTIHTPSSSAVLKIYGKKDFDTLQNLYDFLDVLRLQGIKTPKCLQRFQINHHPAILLEFCEGIHPFFPSDNEIVAITEQMAVLHQLSLFLPLLEKPSLDKSILLDFLKKCPSLPQRELIQSLIEDLDLSYLDVIPRGLVHGDFSPTNVLVANNQVVAVLDFDHLAHTDLLTDIARSQIFFAFEGEKFNLTKCEQWIQTYGRYRPLTVEEQTHFYTHILIHLVKMYLETYYYVEELKEVSKNLFTEHRVFQSPHALLNKIINFLNETSYGVSLRSAS